MKTKSVFLLTIFLLIVFFNAFSNTITVTTSTDSITGSLRDAITNAQSGDEIIFDNSLTNLYIGEQIIINKSLSIIGNPGLTIQGQEDFRVFEINGTNTITVNIKNLKLGEYPTFLSRNNVQGGIILINNSNAVVNIEFCYFNMVVGGGYINTTCGGNGGAIAQLGGSVNISNCTFNGCHAGRGNYTAGGKGGAIYQEAGNLEITNCTFYNNRSGELGGSYEGYCGAGGAIYTTYSTISITNCTFYNNNTHTYYFNTTTYESISDDSYNIWTYNSTETITNSIIANSSWGRTIYNSFSSGGYNIISQNSSELNMDGITTGNVYNSPEFENGGELSDSDFWIPTIALSNTSCAIDALPVDGNGAPAFDQRGFTRVNNIDIGAYEYGGSQNGIEANTLTNDNLVEIYPNPSTGIVNVKFNNENNNNLFTLEILNSLGQTLYSKEIENTNIEQISLLYKGLYFVKITSKNVIQTKKVIIN